MNNKLLEAVDKLESFAIDDSDFEVNSGEKVMLAIKVPINSISIYYDKEMTCLTISDVDSFSVFYTPTDTRIGFICFKLDILGIIEVYDITQIIADLSDGAKRVYDIKWATPFQKVFGEDSYMIMFECEKEL